MKSKIYPSFEQGLSSSVFDDSGIDGNWRSTSTSRCNLLHLACHRHRTVGLLSYRTLCVVVEGQTWWHNDARSRRILGRRTSVWPPDNSFSPFHSAPKFSPHAIHHLESKIRNQKVFHESHLIFLIVFWYLVVGVCSTLEERCPAASSTCAACRTETPPACMQETSHSINQYTQMPSYSLNIADSTTIGRSRNRRRFRSIE